LLPAGTSGRRGLRQSQAHLDALGVDTAGAWGFGFGLNLLGSDFWMASTSSIGMRHRDLGLSGSSRQAPGNRPSASQFVIVGWLMPNMVLASGALKCFFAGGADVLMGFLALPSWLGRITGCRFVGGLRLTRQGQAKGQRWGTWRLMGSTPGYAGAAP
jgi:hypothetical protein